MNLNDIHADTLPHSIEAEHSVLGALLLDNEAIYRIPEVKPEHFYDFDNGRIFAEIAKQIGGGSRCDVLTLFDALNAQMPDCLAYLNQLANNTPSAANVSRYASILVDKSVKRSLIQLAGEMEGTARGQDDAGALIDKAASKLEKLAQKKVKQEPLRLSEMLGNYVDLIQARMDGEIKPIKTGFKDLDDRLDGGLERGTLTVVAGRPSMGKTAMGLCFARSVADWGTALFLSMEMSRDQVNDRNIAALGKLPVKWLRRPSDKTPEDKAMFDNMTHAFTRANDLNLYIDDQTALNMLDIRAKARTVKRKNGLDLIVIDQLSFITGSSAQQQWEAVGEYTRGLLQVAKELDIAVVLLCQLSRKVEERGDKRPLMSDLAMSGSIEQDASNIIFLYRDEVYNPDTPNRGICEVITTKQRQGEPGMVGLAYIGNQTRFEDLAHPFQPQREQPRSRRGFD
jgi:replicative DNA helicase